MTALKRRQFLQFTASALTTLGISQLDIQRLGLGYAKTLAKSTPRKLALLVGINAYGSDSSLKGCINDVYLQQKLLIHRFGFNPKDIFILTDDTDKYNVNKNTDLKPTREGILQAFDEYLIKQAKSDDVVVFHFSGHGSQVFDPNAGFSDQLNSTFVPIDRQITKTGERATVSDIMGETLFLLMSALPTQNVSVVLDSCHSGGGKRGNLLIRAIDGGKNIDPSPQEREYQEKWLSKLGMSREKLKAERQKGIAKGIVIAGAARNQLAADKPFDGFHAGAFTYALTQYLWQSTSEEAVSSVLSNVSRTTTTISSTRQIPEFEVKKDSGNERKPTYLLTKQTPPAEAVITKVEGDNVEFWLGGLESQSFAAFEKGAGFLLLDARGKNLGFVRQEYRDGLIGRGKVLEFKQKNALKPGLFLQEQIRAIPGDFNLRIGLDESLSQTRGISRGIIVSRVQLQPSLIEKKPVDYLLGRITQRKFQELQQRKTEEIPPIGSLGLYTPGLDLIPGSFGAPGESITNALERLKGKFRALLAARLVKLTLNADSSRLKVRGLMRIVDVEGKQIDVAAQAFTVRGRTLDKTQQAPEVISTGKIEFSGGIPKLPLETRVQFQIVNQENRDLYITVLVISSEGQMAVLFPNTWTATVDAALVKAGETRRIPDGENGDNFAIRVLKPLGMGEVLIIASATPIRKALQGLQKIAEARGQVRGPISLDDEATDVIDTLLGEIDRGSRNLGVQQESTVRTANIVNTSQLAAMSITYRAVE